MSKLIYVIGIVFGLYACGQVREQNQAEIALPFYNSPDYTPEWITPEGSAFNKIHTIAQFEFLNQNGDTISNETLDGHIYVANFFFSICPNVCPKMTKNLLDVQSSFIDNDKVKILSHTVMPWVDSVARLQEYAQLNDINPNKWYLLTGDKKEIYQLARKSYFADEGFGKSLTTEEDFLHTENVLLIDQKRRIRGVYNGTSTLQIKRMMEDIETLLKEQSPP